MCVQLEERINIQILRVEGLNKDMVLPYQHITGKMGMSAFEILGLVEDCFMWNWMLLLDNNDSEILAL